MNISEIQDLIKFVSKSGVTEVEIEQKEFKITIKADPTVKKKGRSSANDAVEQAMIPQQMMITPQMVAAAPAPAAAPAVAAAPAPAAAPAATEAAPAAAPAEDNSKYVEIKSPMIGTFYRSSAPDKPPFVSVGDEIGPGKVICIVEAMKLFNEIEAEISGKIVKVLVDDQTPVEYDQPLFLVDPS